MTVVIAKIKAPSTTPGVDLHILLGTRTVPYLIPFRFHQAKDLELGIADVEGPMIHLKAIPRSTQSVGWPERSRSSDAVISKDRSKVASVERA